MVRVFAVGAKLDLRYALTYADFRDKMFALVDARQPRRDELVQAGADDVVSHLQPADPNAPDRVLVNFPEDIGLVAGLIGSRGSGARFATASAGGSTGAFISLILNYQPQIRYYEKRFPGQAPIRYLLLALTDTLYRANYETFRELARAYGVYVTATFNAAPARRISAAVDADLVDLLRDPDEAGTRDYAYVAETPDVFNSTFLFGPGGDLLVNGPDGTLVRSPQDTAGVLRGSLNKVYLTEEEQDILPLAGGRVQDLDVLDTPVGRLASLISKDAWMIDVNDRYDAADANLILQPEAFSEWAYDAVPWSPDNFKAGGFAQVQRNPSFLYNLTSCLVGNLFEITFDGQSAILGKRRKSNPDPTLAWIGQNPDSGFLRVAPWIEDDPILTHPGLSLAERHARLAVAGTHLLPEADPSCATPLSAGACADGYRESVIAADVILPPVRQPARRPGPAVPTSFGRSAPVSADALPARRRQARVAAGAGRVYVVWEDDRFGYDNVFLAVSADGGASFREQRVSDRSSGEVTEMRPAVALAAGGSGALVVWQEFCSGRDDDCGRVLFARFDAQGNKIGGDVRVDRGGEGFGKWSPAIAVAASGEPLVVWVDERDAGPNGLHFEHIYFGRGDPNGGGFLANVRVDSGAPVASAAALDNKWGPAITAGPSGIDVAWTDFRNYNWDIFAAHSTDGLSFLANVRVDDAAGLERLDGPPALVAAADGVGHVVWADRRGRKADTDLFYARSKDSGESYLAQRQIDASMVGFNVDRDTPSNQWHPRVAVSRNDVFVVWQDNRSGDNDIFFTASGDSGASFDGDERVDDSGDTPTNQYRPDLAVDETDPRGRVLYVVWEDDRSGVSDVRIASRLN